MPVTIHRCPCGAEHSREAWDTLEFIGVELTAGAAVELRRCSCGAVCSVELFGPGDWLLCIERRARAAREALIHGMVSLAENDLQLIGELRWAAERQLAKARPALAREVLKKSA